MNGIKVIAGLACSILIVLFLLIACTKNPEKALYEQTIKTLMIHQRVGSFQEVVEYYPELRDVQTKMERIAFLNNYIHHITTGPAPIVSREESIRIQDFNQEVRQLRVNVKATLTQLLTDYLANQSH